MYILNHVNSGYRNLKAVVGKILVVSSDEKEQPLLVQDSSSEIIRSFECAASDRLAVIFKADIAIICSRKMLFAPEFFSSTENGCLSITDDQVFYAMITPDEFCISDKKNGEYFAIDRHGFELWRKPKSSFSKYGRFIYSSGIAFKDSVDKGDGYRTETISRLIPRSMEVSWSYKLEDNQVLTTSNGKAKYIQINNGYAYIQTTALGDKTEYHVICLDVETGETIWHRTEDVLSGYSLDPTTGNLVLCTGKAFHALDGKTGETLVLRNLTIEDSYVDLSIATEDQQIHDGKLFYIGRRNDIRNKLNIRNVAEYGVIDPQTGDKLWFDNFETEYEFSGELFVSGPRVYFSIPGDGYRIFEKLAD